MKRKLSVMMIFVTILLLSGCSALFFDTYYSEKEFQGNQSIDLDSDIQMVRNYAELRRLVFKSMNNHDESMQLRFVGYTGNAVSDIASVCNAVKTESAYGAYCVDYVSYDLTQIVSYYEAAINISYKYSLEELSVLQNTNNHKSFSELLAEELRKETEKVIVKVNNGSSESAVVNALIEQTIRENPLAMTYDPQFTVKIFSGNSSQKIYEIEFRYDETMDNSERAREMNDAVNALLQNNTEERQAEMVASSALSLAEHCIYEQTAQGTAFDALVRKNANSEGISSAFKLMCDDLDVECMIVNGKLEREAYYWNIVKIDDSYYHIDISSLDPFDYKDLFKDDAEQQANYWWNQSDYPDCQGQKIVLNSK